MATFRKPLRTRRRSIERGSEPTAKQRTELRAAYGSYLQSARIGRGLTQAQLASKVGIRAHYLSRIENGWREPGVHTCHRLAKALKLPLAELLSRAGHSGVSPRQYAAAQRALSDADGLEVAATAALAAVKLAAGLTEHVDSLPATLRPSVKMLHGKCEVVADFLLGRAKT